MQDALMQATFLMTTQLLRHSSHSWIKWIPLSSLTGAIQVYHCGVLKMQLFKLWHIFPKGKQEIKKYYAVSVVCHKKDLWKNVSLKKKKRWENSFYFPNNCKYTLQKDRIHHSFSTHTERSLQAACSLLETLLTQGGSTSPTTEVFFMGMSTFSLAPFAFSISSISSCPYLNREIENIS